MLTSLTYFLLQSSGETKEDEGGSHQRCIKRKQLLRNSLRLASSTFQMAHELLTYASSGIRDKERVRGPRVRGLSSGIRKQMDGNNRDPGGRQSTNM